MKKNYQKRDFNIIFIGLNREREELYARINSRVDKMVEAGLEDEVRGLTEYRDLNALKTVGYREFFDYFDGKISREKAIELIKRNSRHYARRQVTWFNRTPGLKWFNPGDTGPINNYVRGNIS
jgi:tRNA dimethylallyltransferase